MLAQLAKRALIRPAAIPRSATIIRSKATLEQGQQQGDAFRKAWQETAAAKEGAGANYPLMILGTTAFAIGVGFLAKMAVDPEEQPAGGLQRRQTQSLTRYYYELD